MFARRLSTCDFPVFLVTFKAFFYEYYANETSKFCVWHIKTCLLLLKLVFEQHRICYNQLRDSVIMR